MSGAGALEGDERRATRRAWRKSDPLPDRSLARRELIVLHIMVNLAGSYLYVLVAEYAGALSSNLALAASRHLSFQNGRRQHGRRQLCGRHHKIRPPLAFIARGEVAGGALRTHRCHACVLAAQRDAPGAPSTFGPFQGFGWHPVPSGSSSPSATRASGAGRATLCFVRTRKTKPLAGMLRCRRHGRRRRPRTGRSASRGPRPGRGSPRARPASDRRPPPRPWIPRPPPPARLHASRPRRPSGGGRRAAAGAERRAAELEAARAARLRGRSRPSPRRSRPAAMCARPLASAPWDPRGPRRRRIARGGDGGRARGACLRARPDRATGSPGSFEGWLSKLSGGEKVAFNPFSPRGAGGGSCCGRRASPTTATL